jgi:hypothetical protein
MNGKLSAAEQSGTAGLPTLNRGNPPHPDALNSGKCGAGVRTIETNLTRHLPCSIPFQHES